MATATRTRRTRTRGHVGPADHGRKMAFEDFIRADFEEGGLYELARGVIVVTQVPAPEPHGLIVYRLADMLALYNAEHPGLIQYRGGGQECRIRAPGMKSDRHPDQAVYLDAVPAGGSEAWTRWVPHLVVEVISRGSKRRDYVEKAEEYLRIGVRKYWIIDPAQRQMLVHQRVGDIWDRHVVSAGKSYRTPLLPGLVVRPAALLGPAPGNGH